MANNGVLWQVVVIGAVGGALFGFNIGYCGVAVQFNTYMGNCTRYETAEACNAKSVCAWTEIGIGIGELNISSCEFKDQLETGHYCLTSWPKDVCTAVPHCMFQDNACVHENEWDASEQGLFSGMMIVGAMLSSIPAGWLLNRFGRKKVIVLSGSLGMLAGVLFIIGWQHNSGGELSTFGLLTFGRFVTGLAVGITSVASPMYVGEMSGDRKWPGMLFQIFCTLGIFAAALIAFLIHHLGEDLKTDDKLQAKFQVLNVVITALAAIYTLAGLIVREPEQDEAKLAEESLALQKHHNTEPKEKIPWTQLKVPIISAIALSAAQQLTGINAIMNYAPQLSSNFGLKPLEGNMLIMLWNFVTTIASLKLSSLLPATKMFVIFAYIASAACLLTGIPTFPSVFSDGNKAGEALSAIGIAVFIAAFEMGMGPSFYVIAQSLFPASRRSEGCSFTLVTQFVFNVIMNWCYPICVTAFSGGKNADQRKGTAIMFLSFGIIGILCTFGLMVNLARQKNEESEEDGLYKEPQ